MKTYVVRLHFESSFIEWILPQVNNQVLTYTVPTSISELSNDFIIKLSVFDGIWYIEKSNEYTFNEYQEEIKLEKGMLIRAKIENKKFNINFDELSAEYLKYSKYKLPNKTITIGRKEYNNDISFDYMNSVSGNHCELGIRNGVFGVYDTSRNGTYLNGKRVGKYQSPKFAPLKFGDEIYILGLKVIYLGDCIAINESFISGIEINLNKISQGKLVDEFINTYSDIYERSPRKAKKLNTEQIAIESAPNPSTSKRQPLLLTIGPSFTMVIPMAVGILFTQWSYAQAGTASNSAFMYMGIITSVTSAIIGVGWALANLNYNKKESERAEKLRVDGYRGYISKIENVIIENQNYNKTALNTKYPTSLECLSWVSGMNHRLWENNHRHEDFMTIRIGTGRINNPNQIVIPKERYSLINDDLQEEPSRLLNKYSQIDGAPVLLNFIKTKLLGLVGENRTDIAKIIISQLATRYSYNEVKIAYLSSERTKDTCEYKWIPHTWSDDHKIRMIAESKNDCKEIFYYINTELRNRFENKSTSIPHFVLFVEKGELLEDETFLKRITSESMGVTVVIMSDRVEHLPNECNEILEDDDLHGYYFLDEKEGGNDSLTFDYVNFNDFKKEVRLLSNFRIKEQGVVGAIPELLTYTDMLNIPRIEEINVYRQWLENRSYESMKSLIGFKAGNMPVYLDIHEKAHGPHGLVAGTTGSGKSEMLQTYILSLALNYHPYEVSFILIDYKGGGMAQSFEKLPHTSGVITNLGGNQTNRALASINSEIRRRQRVFNENHVKHIDEYIELFRNEKVDEPIPHLIIIADEFAELKKEQPEFVRELVSASRIGRSLGVHLILATQKPNGVVDDEIWGNSKFRVCLRVQDKQDSNEMIKRTDAAYITNVGRGFLQVGNNEIFEEFQSAWSGAPYVESNETAKVDYPAKMIDNLGRTTIVKKKKSKKNDNLPSQLDTAVNYIRRVFDENNIVPLNPVWLEPLKKKIGLSLLKKVVQNKLNFVIGLADDPVHQCQLPVHMNLMETGNIMIAGSVSSGKTSLLQTLVYSLIENNDSEKINLYIADFSSRMMNSFLHAPHVGGVIFENEADRAQKLINFLKNQLAIRKNAFAEQGVSTYKEYSRNNNNYPAILTVIDNLPLFMEGITALEDDFFLLSREGVSYGIYFVATCNSASEIRAKVRSNFQTGIGLQLADRFEYESVLGERTEFMPENKIPGRGLLKVNSILEFQAAMISDSMDTATINQHINEKCKYYKLNNNKKEAIMLPRIPSDLSISTLINIPEIDKYKKSAQYLPLGYDKNNIELICHDLSKTLCFTVSGGAKTGKTTFLTYLTALKHTYADVYVISDNTEENNIFEKYGAKRIITNEEELFSLMSEIIVPEFSERNSKHKSVYNQQKDISMDDYLGRMKPIFILINDMQLMMKMVYGPKNMSGFFEMCFRRGKLHGIYFIAAISQSDYQSCLLRPAFKQFIEWKDGVHLGGLVDQQYIFDYDLPIVQRNKKLSPGNAYYTSSNGTIHLLLPQSDT